MISALLIQFQSEKEKYVYDFDNMQAQLDKSAGQLSRVQKEKENIQQEMERIREKHDKNQASTNPLQPHNKRDITTGDSRYQNKKIK